MSSQDSDINNLFESAAMSADPDPVRMRAVRERMTAIGSALPAVHRRRRNFAMAGGLLLGLTAAGVAGTETGREWVRQMLIPIMPSHTIGVQGADGHTWRGVTRTGDGAKPFTPAEAAATKSQMDEIAAIQQAGGGRLTRLSEGPGITPGQTMHVIYGADYTLNNGTTTNISQSLPTGQQAVNMHLDEIMKLRDSGAGEIIAQQPGKVGLGDYKIRFTLADGSTVDLSTNYPPGPREQREAIFAETRTLKKQRQFKVLNATAGAHGHLWGTLQYTLADGRTVGIIETVPADMVTPDGKSVIASAEAPAESAGK